MQEVNNMIEFSKMVMFSDVNTELEAVKQFIKVTDDIKNFYNKSNEVDMSLKEIYLAIENICTVLDFIAPKEAENIRYGGRNEVERVNTTYYLEKVLSMINAKLSNYISINDLWEEE
ncbi:hypothetical protein [Macrococcoides caseolyticum]|uniref:hypothetical protein n=1 Tax=Macrococcoides caseolyticum TaxID=69966 RepID=UPI00119CA756|nr:hypothetical protein [Macrococcus caseolyticus]